MVKAFLDLNSITQCLVTKDNTVVYYSEIKCNNEFRAKLESILRFLQVQDLTVVVHGILSGTLFDNSIVAFNINRQNLLHGLVCRDDLCNIMSIANEVGITDVRFISKFGYYEMYGDPSVCYVEQAEGVNYLLCVDNGIKDFLMCSNASLEESKARFCAKNGLTSVMNGDELFSSEAILVFNNAYLLEQEGMAKDLSVLAYAVGNHAKYVFTADVLKQPQSNPQPKAQPQIKTQPQPKLKKAKQTKKTKKGNGIKVIIAILIAVVFLVIVSVLVVFKLKDNVDRNKTAEPMQEFNYEVDVLEEESDF